MHPNHVGPYGINGEEKRGIDFLEFAAPRLVRDGKLEFVYTFDEPSPPTAEQREQQAKKNNGKQQSNEFIMTKHGQSVFINTPLQQILDKKGIKTLLIAGMATDGAVSTAVRMAHNLGLMGKWGGKGNVADASKSALWTDGAGMYVTEEECKPLQGEEAVDGYLVDMPRIVLISDATRTFGKNVAEADVVHRVHVESLREYAEVRRTEEVLEALK
jgi:predicted heme/steroid binding protein